MRLRTDGVEGEAVIAVLHILLLVSSLFLRVPCCALPGVERVMFFPLPALGTRRTAAHVGLTEGREGCAEKFGGPESNVDLRGVLRGKWRRVETFEAVTGVLDGRRGLLRRDRGVE